METSKAALLPEMRLDFWDALWHGQIVSTRAIERRLSILELPIRVDSPCCRCVLRLTQGEAYLSEIWRYGRDRLRMAVMNLLPDENSGVVYGVCRLTKYHIYIVACATEGLDAEALSKKAGEDTEKLIRLLDEYLDLASELKEIVSVPTVAALALRD